MAPQPRSSAVRYVRNRQIIVILLLLAAAGLTSCSRKKTISPDEVRSAIRSAYSFVAESEMFIAYVRQGHATRHYARAHATYLEDAIKQFEEELKQAAPEPRTENVVTECRTYMKLLRHELSRVTTLIGNSDGLVSAGKRVESIRKSLGKASQSL